MNPQTSPDPSTVDASSTTGFSGRRARMHAARTFLLRVMPLTLALVTVLTVTSVLFKSGNGSPQLLVANAAFWLVQGALAFVVVTERANPITALGVFLAFATIIEFVALYSSPEPVASASSLLFFVVASAYFLPTRSSIALTIACTVAVCVAAYTIDAWGKHFILPSTSFTILIVGLLSTFVSANARRTETRLEHAIAEERDARRRLEQVDASRNRLVANVSHELRTPLTSTIGAIETLLRDDVSLDEAQRERLLKIARDGGLRLLVLVEDLLTIGSTRPDSLHLTASSEELGSIVRDAVIGIDPGAGREIHIAAVEDAPVRVDRMRMLQVVTNLVVNGIRHGRGDVLVQVDVEREHATLRVIDDGDGVPADHEDELFLPFARFSTRSDSTGLGLAICRTLVEAHGGSIRYQRTGDGHTTFVVELPLDERA